MIGWLEQLDAAVMIAVHRHLHGTPADAFFAWITDGDRFRWILAGVWVLLLLLGGRRGRITALLVAVTLLVTDQVSAQLLKPWVARVRPCFALPEVTALIDQVHSPSFPSSHATNVAGAATLLSRYLRGRWRWSWLAAACVAYSRIHVGVHYPLDVLAGVGLGIACALAVGWLGERVWSDLRQGGTPPEKQNLEPDRAG